MRDMTYFERALRKGNAVRWGEVYTIETAQEDTLDRICFDIEQGGGIVLKIEEVNAPPKTGEGLKSYRRIFLIDAVIPLRDSAD